MSVRDWLQLQTGMVVSSGVGGERGNPSASHPSSSWKQNVSLAGVEKQNVSLADVKNLRTTNRSVGEYT